MEFNTLHPMHHDRERGWEATPNPFAPKQPMTARYHTDKHIFVYANQLWYDIDATTNLLSRSRRIANDAQAGTLPTSENDHERPLFYRWFDKYMKKAEGLLSAYLMKKEGTVRDNAIKEWDEQEIWLRMPDYWDDTRYDSLVQAIHNYIAAGALYEYFKLTLTSKDPLTTDKAAEVEDAELDILDASNATKPGSVHKPYKPF